MIQHPIISACAIFCITVASQADTWTVDDDGKADFDNIQAAVDAASDGDEIIVMPGVYTSENDCVVNLSNKNVWLHGSDQTLTIINGEQNKRGIVSVSNQLNLLTIENITIRDCIAQTAIGSDENNYGGGTYFENSIPTFKNCAFLNNVAGEWGSGGWGGAVYLYSCNSIFTDCSFVSNHTIEKDGGAIQFDNSQGTVTSTLTNCTFDNNNAARNGGAIYCGSHPDLVLLTLNTCSFTNNVANGSNGMGGGAICRGTIECYDCLFQENAAQNGGAINAGGFFSTSRFFSNQATEHGGACLASGGVFENCFFAWNSASNSMGNGGAINNGGSITDCVFTNNSSYLGSAIYNAGSLGQSLFCENSSSNNEDVWPSTFDDLGQNVFYNQCGELSDVVEWNNPFGGNFGFWGNWFPLLVPTADDDLYFNLTSSYVVTFSENSTNNTLKILDGEVTLNVYDYFFDLIGSDEPGIVIGENANGTDTEVSLTIQGGSTTCISTVIAKNIGSKGSLTLQGNATYLLAEQELIVGNSGEGALNLLDGAYLVSRNGTIGAHPGSYGTVNLQGEGTTWELPFFLTIDHGTVEVGAGASLQPGYFFALFGDGYLGGDGSITSDILNFGEVTPGDSISRLGTLFIDGDYEQVGEIPVLGSGSGTLNCNITETGHSDIYVTGTAILGGGLIANLSETYDPSTGSTFRLLSSASVIDHFDVVLMPGLSEGKYMSLAYDEVGLLTGSGGIDIVVDTFANLLDFDDPENIPIAGSPLAIVIANFDNDSFDDIAITLAGTDAQSPGNILILISDGLGGFSSSQQIAVGANPVSVTTGDFDNDGFLDLAVSCANDNAVYISQNAASGDGSFTTSWGFSVGNNPQDVEAVHLDDDGVVDLAVAATDDDAIELWLSTPAVSEIAFASDGALPTGDSPPDIDPGDVNDDKVIKALLFATNNNDGTVTVWQKDALAIGGAWHSQTLPVGNLPVKIKSGDINEDGHVDAIIANTADGTVSVLLADTFGGYLPQVALPVGASPSSIAVVDFDDDGDKDIAIVASNGTGDRVVHVLRNDLNLTDYEDLIFASATELANGENPSMIAYGDLDGDNTTDLVSVSSTSGLRGEVPAMISTRGIEVAQICIGDLNETGEVDVIDLLIVINQWGLANSPADVNFDGIVDVSDLLIVVGNWGPCK